jgi:16S rRNA (uracil1498-N3)-methyltransferase
MHRLYVDTPNILEGKIVISDQGKIHHLRGVLRLKIGEEITVFDGKGNEYLTEVKKFSGQSINLKIKERRVIAIKKVYLAIACAIPKKSKIDEIIDKLTQLGADRIIPMLTERVIVKLDKHKKILREARWKKIAQSASEQSQRSMVPIIVPVKNFKEVLSEAKDFDLKLIPTLSGKRKLLKEIIVNQNPKNILVLIGPEGDFTDAEVDLAKKSGFVPVSLTDTVLRVDTAAIAVASFIKLYEDKNR